jgi:uncharacterized protein YdaU (DUF1376 family)
MEVRKAALDGVTRPMVKKAYLPLYVRDFLSDPLVVGMPFKERAAYLFMLMLSWEVGPLPDDPARIARMIGLARTPDDSTTHAVCALLQDCFEKGPAGWTNPRLERERVRVDEILVEARERTRKARAAKARLCDSAVTEQSQGCHSQYNQAQAQAQEEEEEEKRRAPGTPHVLRIVEPAALEGGSAPGRSAASPPPRGRSKKARKPDWAGVLPPGLAADPAFPESWRRWISFRRDELRKPVTQLSGEQALREIEAWGPERGVRAIEHTIARGWQGLREPEQPRSLSGRHEKSTDQILREIGLR